MSIQMTTSITPCEGNYEEIQLIIEQNEAGVVIVKMLDKTFDIETMQGILSHMEYLDKLPTDGE